jgi:hypothetical protein
MAKYVRQDNTQTSPPCKFDNFSLLTTLYYTLGTIISLGTNGESLGTKYCVCHEKAVLLHRIS